MFLLLGRACTLTLNTEYSSVFSVLGTQGSGRPSTDCTAWGQDKEGLAEVVWTRLILRPRREWNWSKTERHLQSCLWPLGVLEPTLVPVQAAGATGRGWEGLEEANRGTRRPESRGTREERGSSVLLKRAHPLPHSDWNHWPGITSCPFPPAA